MKAKKSAILILPSFAKKPPRMMLKITLVRNNYLEKGDIAVIAAGMQQVDGKMEASVEIRTVDN